MKDYQNTISEWKELFQKLEDEGRGNEVVACAVWFKETVEHQMRQAGYRLEMSAEEWADVAHNTEDAWSAFDEEDMEYVSDKFNLEFEGEE